MNKQPTRRRRASRAAGRSLALAVGTAALVALLGAGQALATLAPPDERVLERQGGIDHQQSAGQAGEQGKAEEPSQGSPAGTPWQAIRPEPPPTGPPPPLGDGQVAPGPTTAAPAGGRGGLVVIAVLAALLLTVGAATTWRVRHRRPQPGSPPERSAWPPDRSAGRGRRAHPATPSGPREDADVTCQGR